MPERPGCQCGPSGAPIWNLSGALIQRLEQREEIGLGGEDGVGRGRALPVAAFRGFHHGGDVHALVRRLVARIDGAGFEQADIIGAMVGIALGALREVRQHGRAHVVEIGGDRIVDGQRGLQRVAAADHQRGLFVVHEATT